MAVDEERSTEKSQRTKSGESAGRRENINWKGVEMTETSEEKESEKDEDEMNGYDEETMIDEIDKSGEGLEKGTSEGNVEEEDAENKRETERSDESSKSQKGRRKDKNRVRMYDYFVNLI